MRRNDECGHVLADWEFRCTACALARPIPLDWPILLVSESLRSRIVRWAVGFAGVSLTIYISHAMRDGLSRLLTGFIGEASWAVLTTVMVLGMLAIALMIAFAVYPGKSTETWSVSKGAIEFSGTYEEYESLDDIAPSDIKIIDGNHPLAEVGSVEVRQGVLGRFFNYGDIRIVDGHEARPRTVIPGVVDPLLFQQKLKSIVAHRDDVAPAAATVVEVPMSVDKNPPGATLVQSPMDLFLPVWLAVPLILAVLGIVLFIVGFIIGVVTNPIAALAIVLFLCVPFTMFCTSSALTYYPGAKWSFRATIYLYVAFVSASVLVVVSYALVNSWLAAAALGALDVVAALVGAIFYGLESLPTDLLEFFARRKPTE